MPGVVREQIRLQIWIPHVEKNPCANLLNNEQGQHITMPKIISVEYQTCDWRTKNRATRFLWTMVNSFSWQITTNLTLYVIGISLKHLKMQQKTQYTPR